MSLRSNEDAPRRSVNELEAPRAANVPGRSWLPWLWIWIMVVAIGFFWFAGWGWGGYGGWWWGGRQGASRPTVSGSGLAVLDSNYRTVYVGQQVTLWNLPVVREVNDRVYWVKGKNTPPMLLVVTNPATSAPPKISPGDRIAVTGTIEKAPPAPRAEQEWNLNTQDAQTLEHEQAYLQSPAIERTR